jgi:hypothetical protein
VTELASTLAKQWKVKAIRIRDGLSAVSMLTVWKLLQYEDNHDENKMLSCMHINYAVKVKRTE